MVKAIACVLLLCATASAEPPQIATDDPVVDPPPVEPKWRRLGTRIGFGRMPIRDTRATTMQIGVALDHPLAGRWRVLAEYEYVWLGVDPMIGVASMEGSGSRVHAGIRRTLAAKRIGRAELLVDGELGAGALAAEDALGVVTTLHAFVGARFVLALVNERSRWEYEVLARAIVQDGGAGGVFGIGLVWGE
jgi:hypothetical protein